MGLLDEAIREHLELKRRSGADPNAVEREEREALAPVLPDGDTAAEGDGSGQPQEPAVEVAPAAVVPVDDHQGADATLAELSSVGQDTAELDMRAVLEEGLDAAEAPSAAGPVREGAQSAYANEGSQEESLEWETASERDHETAPEDVPGQERLSFD